MFNSNTTNEYNYYDKQGRYIGTKRIVPSVQRRNSLHVAY